jgi:YVTN family beta-propeller protein
MTLTVERHRLAVVVIIAAVMEVIGFSPALAQKAYVPLQGRNTVDVVDLAAGTITGSFAVNGGDPPNPRAVAVSPDSRTAYVVEPGTNSVAAVTLATGAISATIPVGSDPVAIAVARDGSMAYVVNAGDDTVSPVSLATGIVGTPIAVGMQPTAIALTPDGSRAFVANQADFTVSVIDTASGTTLPPIVGGTPSLYNPGPSSVVVTPDGTTAFAVTPDVLLVIDVATAQLVNTVILTTAAYSPDEGNANALAVTPDGRDLYIAAEQGLQVFDVATVAPIRQIPLLAEPTAFAFTSDGKTIFLTNPLPDPQSASGDSVFALDVASGNFTKRIAVGNSPAGIAATPDGSSMIVPNTPDETLSVISTATQANAATIKVGPAYAAPSEIVFSPDGTAAYVSAGSNDAVYLVDAMSDTVLDAIAVGSSPAGIAVTPDGQKVYVANQDDDSVSVIDAASRAVTATIAVGGIPNAIAMTPDGGKLYAAISGPQTISVISTATDTVVGQVALLASMPTDLVVAPDGRSAYVFAYAPPAGHGAPYEEGVYRIDTATDQLAGIVYSAQTNSGPSSSLAITPNGATLFIGLDGAVLPVDLRSGQVGAGFSADGGSGNLVVTPDGGRLFGVAGTMVVGFDIATDQVSTTLAVPGTPDVLGVFIQSMPSPLTSAVLPASRSVALGATATVFATILNAGAATVKGCAIGLDASAPEALSLTYQTTDPATNLPTGTPNTPVSIAGNGAQSFLLALQASAGVSAPGQALTFTCAGVPPAPMLPGVNTVDLGFSATPTQDIIALAATAPQPGVVTVPLSTGAGAFAIATYNVGIAGTLTVSADTGAASLPINLALCPTDPATARCVQAPAASFQQSFAANAASTFSVFVGASGAIPFSPGASRIFVRFTDANGVTHGSTSVAVDTD